MFVAEETDLKTFACSMYRSYSLLCEYLLQLISEQVRGQRQVLFCFQLSRWHRHRLVLPFVSPSANLNVFALTL